MPPLTEAQVARYHADGWLAPIDILSEVEAAEALAALEDAEARFPEDLHAGHRNNAHLVLPFLSDLAVHERILDCVASVVDRPRALLNSVLFIKEPGSAGYVSWHQDSTYMGVDTDDMVTAWVALTPSTTENGCVTMVSGSHREGIHPHEDRFAPDNILTRGQEVSGVDVDAAVDVELRPGQISLHHPWLVHGSRPNRTEGRRVGVAFQAYVGAELRPERGEHHVIAVGDQPVDPAFKVVPRPDAVMTNEGRRIRAAANTALSDVLYHGASVRRDY
ncbi:MAG: phytanoyl-CoA dioxygenase family protein [Actinomycetota bacterium]|nr:phytanoyl-CoA dioxygenase family protein [Actinomycetota bacterium]